ncbi:unnamed protein product [Cuscuta campestris]|uniref:Serine carboxypeptidase S28 family protein n=1 Tax=Cuscuta campestris TaxID=132261 RepID=A0A484LKX6_9ASTE|nr:unnamed protein product [Cuscuta campestris]
MRFGYHISTEITRTNVLAALSLSSGSSSGHHDLFGVEDLLLHVDRDLLHAREAPGCDGNALHQHIFFVFSLNRSQLANTMELTPLTAGFLTDIAPTFKALLVYIEHRFYGESIPMGKMEDAMRNKTTRGFFNSGQALADYAQVLLHIKKQFNATKSPIVVIGGSYGGMLAAWFRMKYPHVAMGALASSAPILYFDNITPQDGYYSIVTNDFKGFKVVGAKELLANNVCRGRSIQRATKVSGDNGSHCLDLLGARKTDPDWLTQQREREVKIIQSWIQKVVHASPAALSLTLISPSLSAFHAHHFPSGQFALYERPAAIPSFTCFDPSERA